MPHQKYEFGKLAVNGWAVTFGIASRGLGGLVAQYPPRCTTLNGQCVSTTVLLYIAVRCSAVLMWP